MDLEEVRFCCLEEGESENEGLGGDIWLTLVVRRHGPRGHLWKDVVDR